MISGTADDFFKANIDIDVELLSDNQKDKSYMLKIDNYEEDEVEANRFNVNAIVELTFLIPNSDTTKYKPIVDNYVHRLVKAIQATHTYTVGTTWGMEVLKISVSKLNDFNDSEMVVNMGLTIKVTDYIPLNLSVPSAPTLTAPSNGSVAGTIYQTFNWTGTADTWDFSISLDGVEVLSQTGLVTSSFTIPLDSGLTDTETYSWQVRGRNAAGVGTWATAFTFTVNETPAIVYEPETEILCDRFGTAPTDTRKGHINTCILTLKNASIWDRLDVLHIYECHSITNDDWGKNWRKVAHDATSSPTSVGLTIDAPVTTNGTSSYIDLNYTPLTDGIAYSQNRASIGYKRLNNVISDGFDIGMDGSLSFVRFLTRGTGNAYAFRLNTIGGAVITGTNATSVGFHVITRETLTRVRYLINGTLIANDNSQTSATIPSQEMHLGHTSGGASYVAGSYGAFFAGTYLSDAQVATLVTAINTYLTAIGGQV